MSSSDGVNLNSPPAISFSISTKDQKETDYYWSSLTADGGAESQCAWCKDKFGMSWQVVPDALMEFIGNPDRTKADRAVQNTHEQMVPFLVSMWTYALVVSPNAAAGLGGVYVVLRAVYPVLLGSRIEQVQPRRVAFVTLPCYSLIAWMLVSWVVRAWSP